VTCAWDNGSVAGRAVLSALAFAACGVCIGVAAPTRAASVKSSTAPAASADETITPPLPAVTEACATETSAVALDTFFAADGAAGLAGGDYPHVIALPDGRVLWLFQDAFLGDDTSLFGDRFAHNAALVQDGPCFRLLPAGGGVGTSFVGSWVEQSLTSWIWPLDAELGADGYLWLYLAEVQNADGTGAAKGARPIGTWRARFSLPDLQLVDMAPASDRSRSLYGYSIVSDLEWTYLFGHCYRQFGSVEYGFSAECSPYAYLARVPKGRMDLALEYWDGDGWSDRHGDAQAVLTAERSMPVSIERFGDVYVAASKENDWFGNDIVVRTAALPQGPWTEVARFTPELRCAACNDYGAFVLPHLEGDQVVIAYSNNAWDMSDAILDASLYRIDVTAIEVPGVSAASLARTPQPQPVPIPEREPEARSEREFALASTVPLRLGSVIHSSSPPPRWVQWSLVELAGMALLSIGLLLVASIRGGARSRDARPRAASAGTRSHGPRRHGTPTG
jgi:hypothetical protein